jgi:hypothetical protein
MLAAAHSAGGGPPALREQKQQQQQSSHPHAVCSKTVLLPLGLHPELMLTLTPLLMLFLLLLLLPLPLPKALPELLLQANAMQAAITRVRTVQLLLLGVKHLLLFPPAAVAAAGMLQRRPRTRCALRSGDGAAVAAAAGDPSVCRTGGESVRINTSCTFASVCSVQTLHFLLSFLVPWHHYVPAKYRM